MPAIRRLLCVSFVLSFVVSLQAAVTGVAINIDGKPVSGAKVSLFAPELIAATGPRLMSADPQRKPLATMTTDSGGKFTIDVPKDQTVVDIRIDAPGYAPAGLRLLADDDAGAMLLTQAPMVRGTITANGKPVANATVSFLGGSEFTTKTDADGHYTAPDPSKWVFRALVIHPDYAIIEEQLGPAGTKKGPDFSLNAGVPITGRVVAEDGQTPVADAQISLDGWPAGKSAADGTFAIAHARREWDTVEARTGNRIAQRAHTTTSANLKLAKGGTVSGSVRDVKSQLPVVGARIAIAPSGRFNSREAALDAISDAKGNFTLSPLAAGTYDVRPTRPGFNINGAQSVTVKPADSVQKALYATARGRISGSVADEDKRPVAAAHLNARATARGDNMFSFSMMPGRGSLGDSYSAPDGHFVLREVEVDSDLQVDALKRGFPSGKSASMKLAPGEKKTGVMITIPRGVAVTGRVTNKDHKPLSGVGVEAIESANDAMGGMRRMVIANMQQHTDDTYRTGSDGTFSIRVKEGTYDLAFKREGFSAKNVRGTKVDANTKPIDVVLDPGVEIAGRITRGGAGVEGVNVRAMSQDGFAGAVSGPDGAFRITDLTPGQMMLNISKQESFIQEIRSVSAPTRDLVIELPPGGRITGHVLDKNSHQPVTSFMAGVTTSRSGGGMMVMMPPMQKQFTSDDGSFVLEGVKPGMTEVVVNAPGYTTARVPNIEIEDGKTAPDVEVDVETGAKLIGRVTGPDGSPLAGVSVRSDPMGGGRVMRFNMTDNSATTDPSGEYMIDTLEAGEKTFTFSRSGYIAQQKTVTIAGGKDSRLDVQMSSGMRATGFVVTDAGAPIPDATVRAVGGADDGGRSGRSDANGAFTIEGLAPGHYTFNGAKNGYSAGIVRDVDIATSGPVRIILKNGGVITGHVNGLTAQELEQTTVSASGAGSGGGPMGGSTSPVDSAGNFRIEGAPSGTVRISARTGAMFGGSSKSAAPKTVELEPGGTAQVDIDFKSSTVIRGRVTRNGVAVPNAQVMFLPRGAKSQTSASAAADAEGRYELSGLDDGTYTVQAMDMERLNPFATQYDVHGSGTFDIAIKTVTLRGHVVDAADARALAEASIELRPSSGQTIFGGHGGLTDASGNFTIENIAAGSYQITADKPGYGHDARQITIGDSAPEDVQFRLSPSDGITIRAVDTRDNSALPIDVARVVDAQGNELPSGNNFFGSNEVVKLPLAPGTYRVTVMARNYAPQTVTMSSPSQQTVRFSPGGTIILHSHDSTTRRFRLVDASSGAAYNMNPVSQGIMSLPPGTLPLTNVAAATYRLEILDNNDRVTKTIEIVLKDGEQRDIDV
jgi:hypothetical protein